MKAINNINTKRRLIVRNQKITVGLAADHSGYHLKTQLITELEAAGYTVSDFGVYEPVNGYDYMNYVVPLAMALAKGAVVRGVVISSCGIGAGIAANKVHGVRAALITENFSAQHGVEDIDMNLMCLDGQVTPSFEQSWSLVKSFLTANFKEEGKFSQHLSKVSELEKNNKT